MGDASAICSIARPGEPFKLSSFLQHLQGTGVNSHAEVLALVTASCNCSANSEDESRERGSMGTNKEKREGLKFASGRAKNWERMACLRGQTLQTTALASPLLISARLPHRVNYHPSDGFNGLKVVKK